MSTNRLISFLRVSTPNSFPVYGDPVTIFDSNGIPIPRKAGVNLIEIKNTIFCMGSTWPNPTVAPHTPPTILDGKPFDLGYGSLALGILEGRCIFHSKFGKCIIINEGGACPGLYPSPNPDHRTRHVVYEAFVHRSFAPNWRGSAGCLTIEYDAVEDFFGVFKIDEKIKIEIRGNT